MYLRRIILIITYIIIATSLSAQTDREVTRSLQNYFHEYTAPDLKLKNFSLDSKRRNNIVINTRENKITIFVNENFGKQIFTPELVDAIYSDIRKILPRKYRNYKIVVMSKGMSIDVLSAPRHATGTPPVDRVWGEIDYDDAPWVNNISKPYNVKEGVSGRHLAVWQSHGRIYGNEQGRWKWQRPPLFCTTEDLFTQSIVIPFLAPMLENAGAVVYTPRERDWQPLSVVVDNDVVFDASVYSEGRKGGGQWNVAQGGYQHRAGIFVDGENPFAAGTSRYIATQKKRGDAVAVWQPDIPADGRYAVYVSYKTLEGAVPDAVYTVHHSGGDTQFKVNQQIGGGTWVYLGTFNFKKGLFDTQGVTLSNQSEHNGVVSADAVRFGGGSSVVARGGIASGMPRYLEGARYNLLYSGFPYSVYTPSEGEKDYADDINCRSHAVNHLVGGSVYAPDSAGLGVPIEMTFGFHSDAGCSAEDEMYGSLGIVTTDYDEGKISVGRSRNMSRDIIGGVLQQVQSDMKALYGVNWPCRGIFDKNYSESRLPVVPAMIFESLSHQNFKDMLYGHDPNFKFVLARSVYKALLREISYQHGAKYTVQPLPVKKFAISFEKNHKKIKISWEGVDDPLEPTAKPEKYILYTRTGDGGFDNGRIVDGTSFVMELDYDVQYSFKVAALNDGGESFSSEVLSAYIAKAERGRVLIVNGFHRLSTPEVVNTSSHAGFDLDADFGVPYLSTPEYCGRQLDFSRANVGREDGWGLSGDELQGRLLAGNSFDYPYVHGKALANNGISFVSCSSDAVEAGVINLSNYDAVDLILGAEKQGGVAQFMGVGAYKTFPPALRNAVEKYCNGGGRLFVSGAYIASDMSKNKDDHNFIRDVLHFDYAGSATDVNDTNIFGSSLLMAIHRTMNEDMYAVHHPDILVPVGGAFAAFVFDKGKESAGVAYADNYRVLSTSFPFESVKNEEHRTMLMGAVMRFLLNK